MAPGDRPGASTDYGTTAREERIDDHRADVAAGTGHEHGVEWCHVRFADGHRMRPNEMSAAWSENPCDW